MAVQLATRQCLATVPPKLQELPPQTYCRCVNAYYASFIWRGRKGRRDKIDGDKSPGRTQDRAAHRLVLVIPDNSALAQQLWPSFSPLVDRACRDNMQQMPRQTLRLERLGLSPYNFIHKQ
jgi:hypothetical protein